MENIERPKRKGTAFWFPDSDAELLRAVAAAEDRTLQVVLARALRAYARASREYNATLSSEESKALQVGD